MADEGHIETLARGICIKDGCILICRGRKAGNLYFPGGHIEFGESGAFALEREILEETGLEGHATAFLGCAEHKFLQHGTEEHAEINLVYALDIPNATPPIEVAAKESWIAFDWIKLEDLPTSKVEPAALREVVVKWHNEAELAANRIATTTSLAQQDKGVI